MNQIALIIATILDFPTLITAIGSFKTNRLYKVLLWALIASLCGELANVIVRPAYELSIISFYRLFGQITVGVILYGLKHLFKGKDNEMGNIQDNQEECIEKKTKIGEGAEGFFADMGRLLSFKLSWQDRSTLEKSYTAMFIIMVLGLFPMPYEFYDTLRVVVCICLYFFFQAIFPKRREYGRWFALIIGLFVLYNPIVPIRIGEQSIWIILNIVTLIILFKARLVFDCSKNNGDDYSN